MFAIRPTQFRHCFDQKSEDCGAIIVGKFDDPSLHYNAAELDQMPRAFAPLHLPVPAIMARLLRLQPMARGRRPSQRRPARG